jgi:hypothetical protein
MNWFRKRNVLLVSEAASAAITRRVTELYHTPAPVPLFSLSTPDVESIQADQQPAVRQSRRSRRRARARLRNAVPA